MEEVEAQLKSTESDLKNAQKRIETLHNALKSHEDYGSSGEDDDYSRTNTGDDDLSSNASSYRIGEYEGGSGSVLSEEEDLDEDEIEDNITSGKYTSRSWKKTEDLSPIPSDEDYHSSTKDKKEKKTSKSRFSDEDDQEEDEFISNYRKRNKDYLKELEEEEEELDIKLSVNKTTKSSYKSYADEDDDELLSKPRESSVPRGSSLPRRNFDDDDDDDDEGLEEFLLKQKERLRTSIELADENIGKSSSIRRSPARKDDAEGSLKQQNGTRESKSRSREPSADVHAGDDEHVQESKTSRQRRNRQRKRTIEQLTSPEHQAAAAVAASISSNGVH